MDNYNKIKVLKGLEGIQIRPGMYVGDVSNQEAALNCIWEVIANSFDEHIAGFGNRIEVCSFKELWSIKDNGRGIPNEFNQEENKLDLELAFTIIHSGGKFDSKNYKFSSGLHGVGLTAVNALSKFLICLSVRKNRQVLIIFNCGKVVKTVIYKRKSLLTGTWIIFKLNKFYLPERSVNHEILSRKFRFLNYVAPKLDILFNSNKNISLFNKRNGIKGLFSELNKDLKPVFDEEFKIYFTSAKGNGEIIFNWYFSVGDEMISITNGVEQPLGGTHVNQLFQELKSLFYSQGQDLSITDIKEGFKGIVNIHIPNPQYSSQTKEKLTSAEGREIVREIFKNNYPYFLIRKKDILKISQHLNLMSKKRIEYIQSKTLDQSSNLTNNILPGKLLDCLSKDLSVNEIHFTEGDSAGASAKSARDKFFQAVLPIKGKIINVGRANFKKIIGFEAVQNIVAALGTGLGKSFQYEKLRYGKIILMADADADGIQIKALITGLFYKYLRKIIEEGHLYVANPPLFKLSEGKREYFFLDRINLENFLWKRSEFDFEFLTIWRHLKLFYSLNTLEYLSAALRNENSSMPIEIILAGKHRFLKVGFKSNVNYYLFPEDNVILATKLFNILSFQEIENILNVDNKNIKRYKGLGQMNTSELWERVMDPESRIIERVDIINAQESEIEFERIMGKNPKWRKILVNDTEITNDDLDL